MNLSQQLKNLADKVIYAESTLSEYYNIGTIKVRISDHMSSDMDCDLAIFSTKDAKGKHYVYTVIPMVGTFKEVQWFTNTNAVIEFIVRFESIARLLIKPPTRNTNQQERIEHNVLAKASDEPPVQAVPGCKDQIKFDTWMIKLATLYAEKGGALRSMLNEIYRFSGNEETMKWIVSHVSNKVHEKKIASLDALIIRIKQNSK